MRVRVYLCGRLSYVCVYIGLRVSEDIIITNKEVPIPLKRNIVHAGNDLVDNELRFRDMDLLIKVSTEHNKRT